VGSSKKPGGASSAIIADTSILAQSRPWVSQAAVFGPAAASVSQMTSRALAQPGNPLTELLNKYGRGLRIDVDRVALGAGAPDVLATPSRETPEVCRAFVKLGNCKFGDSCLHAHVEDVCQFFTRTGWCKFGKDCRLSHTREPGVHDLGMAQGDMFPGPSGSLILSGVTRPSGPTVPPLAIASEELSRQPQDGPGFFQVADWANACTGLADVTAWLGGEGPDRVDSNGGGLAGAPLVDRTLALLLSSERPPAKHDG